MSQTEEFVKVVEAAKETKGVIFVTGKPGSGKSKVLREAAEDIPEKATRLRVTRRTAVAYPRIHEE